VYFSKPNKVAYECILLLCTCIKHYGILLTGTLYVTINYSVYDVMNGPFYNRGTKITDQ